MTAGAWNPTQKLLIWGQPTPPAELQSCVRCKISTKGTYRTYGKKICQLNIFSYKHVMSNKWQHGSNSKAITLLVNYSTFIFKVQFGCQCELTWQQIVIINYINKQHCAFCHLIQCNFTSISSF